MNSNSKRVIKNTGFLYIRMFVLLIINLFTSRVILQNLGFSDYGIYNVIGGLTSMFAFFQVSLSNATQRFFCVELGKNNKEGARNVFSQFIFIYLIFTILVVIALETAGYWFVSHKLNVPPDRVSASVTVFHITVISLCCTLMGTTFNSVIIAHEDMSFYSYMGIFEGVMKLVVAYMISFSDSDRLIVYAVLLLLTVTITQSSYVVWCLKKYDECRLRRYFNKNALVEISKFFSWNFVANIVSVTKEQIVNILLNVFFGPVVNAARGISYQVNSAIMQFCNNITVSVHPQLVKSYATGNYHYMHKLFFYWSKYAVLVFWTISLPVMLNMDFLLHIWLKQVPDYTSVFSIWVLVDSLLFNLAQPTWNTSLATGQLRRMVLYGYSILLLIFPISYIFLHLGYSPVVVFIITVSIRVLQVVLQVKQANNLISFGLINYAKNVIVPTVVTIAVTSVLPIVIYLQTEESIWTFILRSVVSLLSCGIGIYLIAMRTEEKQLVKSIIKSRK